MILGNLLNSIYAPGSLSEKRDSYQPALPASHGSWGPIKVAVMKHYVGKPFSLLWELKCMVPPLSIHSPF